MYSAKISGVGMYVPEKIMTNEDLIKIAPNSSPEWLKKWYGIEKRHIASDDQATSDLSIPAAIEAMKDANILPEDIGLIILATTLPDVNTPSTASIIQGKIGAKNAAVFDLHHACEGFVTALITGSKFINDGTYKNVLIIGTAIHSKWTNWNDRTKAGIFGDGSGAVVLTRCVEGKGIISLDMGNDGTKSDVILVPLGGSKYPPTLKNLGDPLICFGRSMDGKGDGKIVFEFATTMVPKSVEKALNKIDLNSKDLDFILFHQANKSILESCLNSLNIPLEKTLININEYANTSEASVPIALYESLKGNKILKGDTIALTGFGSGLGWATVIMKWD